jgi:hypothetical protein
MLERHKTGKGKQTDAKYPSKQVSGIMLQSFIISVSSVGKKHLVVVYVTAVIPSIRTLSLVLVANVC